jgi:hypothetical protein
MNQKGNSNAEETMLLSKNFNTKVEPRHGSKEKANNISLCNHFHSSKKLNPLVTEKYVKSRYFKNIFIVCIICTANYFIHEYYVNLGGMK